MFIDSQKRNASGNFFYLCAIGKQSYTFVREFSEESFYVEKLFLQKLSEANLLDFSGCMREKVSIWKNSVSRN